jgi:predicted nucleic acid-binding protein
MSVLVDSSVWILYFRGSDKRINDRLNELIDNNQLCTNNLILSEMLPVLLFKKQTELIELLKIINKIPVIVEWDEIIKMQLTNLQKGINNVGIPDLIILQNVLQNNLILFSNDKHFKLMSKYFKVKMV